MKQHTIRFDLFFFLLFLCSVCVCVGIALFILAGAFPSRERLFLSLSLFFRKKEKKEQNHGHKVMLFRDGRFLYARNSWRRMHSMDGGGNFAFGFRSRKWVRPAICMQFRMQSGNWRKFFLTVGNIFEFLFMIAVMIAERRNRRTHRSEHPANPWAYTNKDRETRHYCNRLFTFFSLHSSRLWRLFQLTVNGRRGPFDKTVRNLICSWLRNSFKTPINNLEKR